MFVHDVPLMDKLLGLPQKSFIFIYIGRGYLARPRALVHQQIDLIALDFFPADVVQSLPLIPLTKNQIGEL